MTLMEMAQLLGNFGEFVGALAVFATLAYLAVQVRQNVKAERATALDSSIKTFMEIRQSIFESAEMSVLWMNGANDPNSLDELERVRFRLLIFNILMSFWHIHSQPAELREDLWVTQVPALIRIVTSAGGRQYWDQHQNEFVPSFRVEIDRLIAGNLAVQVYS